MSHEKDRVYFMVSYLDDESLIPIMETVVYLGEQRAKDAQPKHLFQDFESWKQRGAYPNNEEGPGKVFSLPSTEVSNIQSLEAALHELVECQGRRKKRGLQ